MHVKYLSICYNNNYQHHCNYPLCYKEKTIDLSQVTDKLYYMITCLIFGEFYEKNIYNLQQLPMKRLLRLSINNCVFIESYFANRVG